jgi:SAM-dependent MidA family methyltransferase
VLIPRDPSQVAEESSRSAALSALIRARAEAKGNWLPFSEYMEAALYEPGLGYYMTGRPIFGAAGDFITAPELSPLFGACLANGVGNFLAAAGGGDIVEFGAGSGRMAEELFGELASRCEPPARYRIVEPSAELAERQQMRIARSPRTAGHIERFEWLESPPTSVWRGVALANEVLDAVPCDRFRITKRGCEAIGVVPAAGGFEWAARPADGALALAIEALQSKLPEPMSPGFVSELRMRQRTWLASATAGLAQGVMLLIDYGLPRAQYYHASRDGGTLCGFRQHLRVDEPLAMPGAQDLTAWVDFSAVADDARDAGLAVGGFSTQAHYLLSTGIEYELERLAAGMTGMEHARLRQGAATLLLPGEMGERFKVIALTRGIRGPFHGFEFRDLSASL